MLFATAFGVIRLKSLFAAVMLFGIYSLLSAAIFTSLDAVDVAFTEASVGAGISTVLMLGTLSLTGRSEKAKDGAGRKLLALAVVMLTGAVLFHATFDMPHFGDPGAPIHRHPIIHEYMNESYAKFHIPNVVTSVLASYRGYDTFGETTVIFTAGVAVLMLLAHRPGTRQKDVR
ncbi:MAG: DUF4040 domain-containing protein [Planctomycetota bacterium]